MNRAALAALAIGIALGVGVTAFVTNLRRKPEPPAPPAAPPPNKVEAPPPPARDYEEELRALRQQIEDLKATAAEPKPPSPAPSTDSTDPPEENQASKFAERFAKIAKKGLGAYSSAELKALAADIKKAGPEALKAIIDRLLNAETATERFVAGALLEAVGDPAAIAALSQSLREDEDLLVRRMSSHGLAMIGTEASLAALRVAMTEDKDWGVRVNSAYGVAKQGQADGAKMLEEAYGSSTTPSEYRAIVFGALADIAAPTSVPIFRKVLTDSTEIGYLLGAIGALEKMKDAASIPDLQRVAGNTATPANVREAAKKAIETISK